MMPYQYRDGHLVWNIGATISPERAAAQEEARKRYEQAGGRYYEPMAAAYRRDERNGLYAARDARLTE